MLHRELPLQVDDIDPEPFDVRSKGFRIDLVRSASTEFGHRTLVRTSSGAGGLREGVEAGVAQGDHSRRGHKGGRSGWRWPMAREVGNQR